MKTLSSESKDRIDGVGGLSTLMSIEHEDLSSSFSSELNPSSHSSYSGENLLHFHSAIADDDTSNLL